MNSKNIRAERTDEEQNKTFHEVVKNAEKICICEKCGTRILNVENPCSNFDCPNCGKKMIEKKPNK